MLIAAAGLFLWAGGAAEGRRAEVSRALMSPLSGENLISGGKAKPPQSAEMEERGARRSPLNWRK